MESWQPEGHGPDDGLSLPCEAEECRTDRGRNACHPQRDRRLEREKSKRGSEHQI